VTGTAGLIVLLLAVAESLLLGVAAIAPRGRTRLAWAFAAGMFGLAAEGAAAYALLTAALTPQDRLAWLRAWGASGLVLLLPWGLFGALLSREPGRPWGRGRRASLAAGAAALLTAAGAVTTWPAFETTDLVGSFYAAQLEPVGRLAVVLQLLGTVAVLVTLESCLRTSRDAQRWRAKYLLLGLGGIFLMRFFAFSQMLLFHVVLASYLTTSAAATAIGNVLVAAALVRSRLAPLDLAVSRRVVYRSVVAAVLGVYLLVVGVLGWVLHRLGVTEEIFWGSLGVFASALVLAALLLSEDLRWRVKRYIALNFYRSKYDYREQWGRLTARLASLLTPEAVGRELLRAIAEAVGTNRALLFLANPRTLRHEPSATVEVDRVVPSLDAADPLVQRAMASAGPLVLDADAGADPVTLLPAPLADVFGSGSMVVPLRWRDVPLGVILLGPERVGGAYTAEDAEFLAAAAEQGAAALATTRLSEDLAQAREFETFHRLTSFVIHDLKNCISSLSLLSHNALAHFDDREFQQDAVRTLSRTVDRMRALLAKLSSAPDTALRFQAVDLADVAREVLSPLDTQGGLEVRRELAPAGVLGDPEALHRVVQNLVTNAVEAMDGEGVLTVRTNVADGWAVIGVGDTGRGISEEFLREGLFAPFRSTKKGGWGIGLYHSKSIVEGHGGRIDVESRLGEGTVFQVRLPLPHVAAGEDR
jgi:hypothetical protein